MAPHAYAIHRLKPLLLLASLASCANWSSAESLAVDWLYLANNGAWVARSETLNATETRVRLPVARLSPRVVAGQTSADSAPPGSAGTGAMAATAAIPLGGRWGRRRPVCGGKC